MPASGRGGAGISKTVGTIVELLSASAHEPISDRELRMLSDVSKALPDASEALFSFLAKRADGGTACLSVDVPTDAQIFLPYEALAKVLRKVDRDDSRAAKRA